MDYASLKVTDLKAELKKRGIPQTGLRVKQNFIDRLIQDDNERAAAQSETPAEPVEPAPTPAPAPQVTNPVYQEPAPEPPKAPVPQPAQLPPDPVEQAPVQQVLATEIQQAVIPEAAPAPVTSQKVTSISQLIEPVPAPSVAQAPVPTPKPAVAEAEPAPVTELVVEDITPAQAVPAPAPAPEPIQEPVKESVQEPVQEPTQEPTQQPVQDESANKSSSADVEAIKEDTDESRKRKRRSQTPPPSPRSIALKKARIEVEQQQSWPPQEEIKTEGHKLNEDEAPATAPVTAEPPAQDTDVEMKESTPPAPEPKRETEENEAKEQAETEAVGQEESSEKNEKQHGQRKPAGDARFKDLFPATNGAPLRAESPPPAEGDDRMVSPALHPATAALYIRDFMRPLQPAALKRHLCSLAVPPNSSPDPDVIVDFFLDSIKTHCFASFTSIAAASRVRAALHDAIWPEERTRKPLWADFIPEEKVKEWIEIEQAPGNSGRGGPRWEVAYDETEDGIKAKLQEASSITSGPPRPYDSGQGFGREPPTGPRADRMGPGGRQGSQQTGTPSSKMPEHGFKALDDRFLSTVAKPKLYYLPVSREVSDKRLDQFDDLARAGPVSKRGGDEMFRYTFEDTDQFVVQGPEYGPRRGGRGRGGGRGGRGGDWGSSWRDGPWRGRR
ncbi:SAP domain-containing protein [Nannizzia gypsea CBS 118893]|uniref:SAP domain-containing protein n=1 Tax=Arthroderma gypseum (strain ATCC MYA-4604 / CBS 118893) TaxID=535722 RepID=E4UT97_ARTGP|nr:SAP domain-containing protein [Nannizzia gypsea CBS 118893]EFR00658.1 SAP domain-containing protein [Nannizzia gypsea CBS 118893]